MLKELNTDVTHNYLGGGDGNGRQGLAQLEQEEGPVPLDGSLQEREKMREKLAYEAKVRDLNQESDPNSN